MPVHGGPNIVRDGLVLHLDAADRNSYPGSGDIWYDLSGKSNDWNIPSGIYSNNLMNYASNYSGRSASSDWLMTTDCTIDCWYYPASGGIYTGCCETIFGRYWFRFFQIGSSLYTMIGFNNGGAYIYQHPAFTVAYNAWHHIVGMRRNNSFIIWIDGVEMYNTSYGSGLDLWGPNENWYISDPSHSNVKISSIKIYNRGLLDTEIVQNYKSIKSRLGL